MGYTLPKAVSIRSFSQENKSNYWMPSLVAHHANGSFSSIPVFETRIYYLNNHPEGSKVRAFPQGFRMVAGDSFATKPIPDEYLRTGGRIGVAFPDCWDGKNLDSEDHKSHVTYRFGTNGTCPPSHPVQMMEIDLEMGYWTEGYTWDQLMLSTGGKAGYGLYADYLSFWDVNLLQRALDDPTCRHRENIVSDGFAQCKTLVPFRNDAAMYDCKLEAAIPQEDTGMAVPIPNLPGCNLPYNATAGQKKPTCSEQSRTPAMGPPSGFTNFSW
ncbi:hypothetical protein OQA88_8702 [Cercophora sp. LCS_1]